MKIGLSGINTKLGFLLGQRPNFASAYREEDVDIVVSCIASEKIDDWEVGYENTANNLVRFRKIHKTHPKVVLLTSSSRTKQNKLISLWSNETSKAYGWKILEIPPFSDSDAEYIADQVVKLIDRYLTLPRVSTCKRESIITRWFGNK